MWKTFTLFAGYLWPALVTWWFMLLGAVGVQALVLAARPHLLERFALGEMGMFALATTLFGWAACALVAFAYHIGAWIARVLRP